MIKLPKLSYLTRESNREGTYFLKLDLPEGVPFNMAKFVVKPKKTSIVDQHEVKEIWYIASGEAIFTHNGRDYYIKSGDYYFIDSNETHQVHNNSSTEDLVIHSLWWL